MKEKILLELVGEVKDKIGNGFEVTSSQMQKNNGVFLNAINFKSNNCQVSKNIYVDQYIEDIVKNEITIDYAADEIIKKVQIDKIPEACLDTTRLLDRDYVLNHVEYRVVNRDLNKIWIKEMPHRTMLDLLVLYSVVIDSSEDGVASYLLSNDAIEFLDIDVEELDEVAKNNTEQAGFCIQSLPNLLYELCGEAVENLYNVSEGNYIYVLTNKRAINGANVLLFNSVFDNLATKVGTDLFVLPSSIHEVLAISTKDCTYDALTTMVKDVNTTCVTDEEILGYNVYKYSRDKGKLSIVAEE